MPMSFLLCSPCSASMTRTMVARAPKIAATLSSPATTAAAGGRTRRHCRGAAVLLAAAAHLHDKGPVASPLSTHPCCPCIIPAPPSTPPPIPARLPLQLREARRGVHLRVLVLPGRYSTAVLPEGQLSGAAGHMPAGEPGLHAACRTGGTSACSISTFPLPSAVAHFGATPLLDSLRPPPLGCRSAWPTASTDATIRPPTAAAIPPATTPAPWVWEAACTCAARRACRGCLCGGACG